MKLIVLNLWGGRVSEPLFAFIKELAQTADVFCFQEIFNGPTKIGNDKNVVTDLYRELTGMLPEFQGIFHESRQVPKFDPPVPFGLGVFTRKNIVIEDSGAHEIFKLDEDVGIPPEVPLWHRLLQYVSFKHNDKQINIFNLHGLYTGGGKNDTPARIRQSESVRKFMAEHDGEQILCGDFNLNPDADSFRILAKDMHDLIKQKNITSTRSSYYDKQPKFADYILISPGIDVQGFQVLPNEVSDHLSLEIIFD